MHATGKAAPEWSEWLGLKQASLASYLTGAYIFVHYLEVAQRFRVLESIRFHFLFGVLVSAVTLPRLFKNRARDRNSRSLVVSAWFLIAILGVYAVFTLDPATSKTVYIDRVLKFSMMAVFIYASVETVDDLRAIMFVTLLAWLKLGQEGFVGWATGSMMWYNQGIPRLHGSTPWMGHPNSFSGFGVGCLPFCVFLFSAVKSRVAKLLIGMLLAFSLIIILMTGSRTGYVAVLAGLLVYLFLMYKGAFKKLMLVLVGGLVLAVVIPQEYQERFESIFTGQEKEGASSAKRKEIIVDAIKVFQRFPLGIGVGAFPEVRYAMFGRGQNTHNLYLELLTNASVFGLFAFLVLVWKIIGVNRRNAARLEKMELSGEVGNYNRRFLQATARAVAGFIFLRLVLGMFGMDMYEIYWWFALGITLAINKLLILQSGLTTARSARLKQDGFGSKC